RRTRALVQYLNPRSHSDGFADSSSTAASVRSLDAEWRHDVQIGPRHLLSAGGALGAEQKEVSATNPLLPLNTQVNTRVHPLDAYLRDAVKLNDQLTLTGELKLQQVRFDSAFHLSIGPLPTGSFIVVDNAVQPRITKML